MNSETFILILQEMSRLNDSDLHVELDPYHKFKFKEVKARISCGSVRVIHGSDETCISFDVRGTDYVKFEMKRPNRFFCLFTKKWRAYYDFIEKMRKIEINKQKKKNNEAISRAITIAFPDLVDRALLGDNDDK